MKRILGVSILVVIMSLWLVPFFVSAANFITIPCDNTLTEVPKGSGNFVVEHPCSVCTVFTLSQNVLNFIYWDISVPIATVMLLWAGFLMVISGLSGSPGQYQKGKDIITRTLIGICLVFFAWLAIDTLIKVVAGRVSLTSGTPATLPKSSGSFGPWNEVKCKEPGPIIFAPPPPPTSSGGFDTTVPQRLQCPAGATSYEVGGVDVCDPGIKQNIADAYKNPEGESLRVASGGRCANGQLKSYADSIQKQALSYDLDPVRFEALIIHESSGNPIATGPKTKYGTARGLTQMLPSTVRLNVPELRGKTDAEVMAWFLDPGPKRDYDNSIRAGAAYLNDLLYNVCGGNQRCAEAAYNGGPAAVQPSRDCKGSETGVQRWQCPYDSFSQSSPGTMCGSTTGKTDCVKNTGYQATRDYSPTIDGIESQIRSGTCNPTQ